jgi:hypothetical protein
MYKRRGTIKKENQLCQKKGGKGAKVNRLQEDFRFVEKVAVTILDNIF